MDRTDERVRKACDYVFGLQLEPVVIPDLGLTNLLSCVCIWGWLSSSFVVISCVSCSIFSLPFASLITHPFILRCFVRRGGNMPFYQDANSQLTHSFKIGWRMR